MNRAKLLLVTVSLILTSFDLASGCRCIPKNASQRRREAKAVFTGEVIEITSTGVKFKVERSWKGNPSTELSYKIKELDFNGQKFRSSCDVTFDMGEKYLIFARKINSRGEFVTDVCAGTKRLAVAEEDLKQLEMKRPRQDATAEGKAPK